jgi:hypothetical protein
MKTLDDDQMQQYSGGMSATSCGALAMASYTCAMSGFFGLAIFGAAVYLGAGCA